ncbi:MAG TPA: hypothetical protein DC017_03220 [Candidatus Wallbacteria bacterium]|nr:hypothetical protein [Candidatus Wallbacteria bacterium]
MLYYVIENIDKGGRKMIKTITETTLNIPAFINKIAADFGNLLATPSGKGIDRYINEAKDSKEKECYGRLYLICREFLKNNPDNLYASLDLLEVYLRVDQLDAARRILEKLYSKYSKSSIYSALIELRSLSKVSAR